VTSCTTHDLNIKRETRGRGGQINVIYVRPFEGNNFFVIISEEGMLLERLSRNIGITYWILKLNKNETTKGLGST